MSLYICIRYWDIQGTAGVHLHFTEQTIGLSRILSFGECEIRSCANVAIESDTVDEPVEVFDLTLERTTDLSPRISLQPVDAIVLIFSDEGKAVFVAEECSQCA